MIRFGRHNTKQLVAKVASRPSTIVFRATRRSLSTTNGARADKAKTPSAAWFLGAGVVFTAVSLVIQSPFLGISNHNHVVYNDSPGANNSGDGGDGNKSLGARLASYFRKTPPIVDQKDIVLDKDLTVTSWKQLEQTGLVKVPGIMLWGSNKYATCDFVSIWEALLHCQKMKR